MNIALISLGIYLLVLFFVAWYFSRNQTLESYFLNKKSTSLWMMVFSTTATIVGAGATVGVVSEVYNSGISYGIALPVSFLMGMVISGTVAGNIKKIGDKYGAYTIVDFFQKRFDKKNAVLTGVLQLFLITIWIGIQALAISALASVLVGVEFHVAILLSALVTVAYTAIGGLKIDLITDFIQFWIILIVFTAMATLSYIEVGGVSNVISKLPQGHLDLFAFSGPSWFFGAILLSGFLYLGDTAHWQRIFSAKDEKVAQKSFFFAMPFMLFLAIIVLFIGLVASVTLNGIEKDMALFSVMKTILPPQLLGVGFAAILAVAMSSIDSMMIGGSTIIHRAIFNTREINGTNLLFAKIMTSLFGACGFLTAYLVPNIVTLSLIVTYLALIFAPPIFFGIYSEKTSPDASFFAILVPSILLFALYPFVGENTFAVTTPVGIAIIMLYDRFTKVGNKTVLQTITSIK